MKDTYIINMKMQRNNFINSGSKLVCGRNLTDAGATIYLYILYIVFENILSNYFHELHAPIFEDISVPKLCREIVWAEIWLNVHNLKKN